MPKLYEAIVVWDVVVWAESEEDAKAAVLSNIQAGLMGDIELPPSEQVARNIGVRPPRAAWQGQKPLVGAAVSDADYERVKGKTCQQVWEEINKKPDDKTKTK